MIRRALALTPEELEGFDLAEVTRELGRDDVFLSRRENRTVGVLDVPDDMEDEEIRNVLTALRQRRLARAQEIVDYIHSMSQWSFEDVLNHLIDQEKARLHYGAAVRRLTPEPAPREER